MYMWSLTHFFHQSLDGRVAQFREYIRVKGQHDRFVGGEVSAKSAKEKIRRMIGSEDEKAPLSDQKIADILRDDGLNIARRTVAKYREQLGILPARLRKVY